MEKMSEQEMIETGSFELCLNKDIVELLEREQLIKDTLEVGGVFNYDTGFDDYNNMIPYNNVCAYMYLKGDTSSKFEITLTKNRTFAQIIPRVKEFSRAVSCLACMPDDTSDNPNACWYFYKGHCLGSFSLIQEEMSDDPDDDLWLFSDEAKAAIRAFDEQHKA